MSAQKNHDERPSLCVINHNGEPYIQETLESALGQGENFREILLIDDASQDLSLEIVGERFPSVKVFRLSENLGPAAARNVGFENASADQIIFVDNDVCMDAGCVNSLRQALRECPHAAAAMPCVLYDHDRERVQYTGGDAHYLGLMSLHDENRPVSLLGQEIREIGSIVTACFILDRTRWGRDRPFDESFFIYLEDHDFGLRGRLMGKEILSVPSARCFHREGTPGLSLRKTGRYSDKRLFCLIRNRWLVILKNYSLRSIVLLSPLFAIYELCQFAIVAKKGWLLPWFKAFNWMLKNAGAIRKRRRAIQGRRRIPDRDLLTGGPIPFREELTASRFERLGRICLERICSFYWKQIVRFV
jgi:GT2 family glycosyltransferase